MKIKQFIRKTTSLTALWSFIILTISSIIIYIQPHGRFSSWSGQHWIGMDRNLWFLIHINVGFLMITACIVHTLFNLKLINNYFKGKFYKIRFASPELILSLLITAFFVWGTYAKIKPMTFITDTSWNLKQKIVEKYGRPPYANAEQSTLSYFCIQLRYDLNQSISSLKKQGFKNIDANMTLIDISRENDSYPQEIYRTIHTNAQTPISNQYNNYSNNNKELVRGQGRQGRGLRRRNRGGQINYQ